VSIILRAAQKTAYCEGSATTAIRIRLPEGIITVKPMPKPGWKLDTVSGKYPLSYSLGGAKVSEGVTEVRWSGGNLPDTFYDEFVFTSAIANELEPRQDDLFPRRAGMREGRSPLDRDSDRRPFPRRGVRACARIAIATEAVTRRVAPWFHCRWPSSHD
jgi:hypothetical protein